MKSLEVLSVDFGEMKNIIIDKGFYQDICSS